MRRILAGLFVFQLFLVCTDTAIAAKRHPASAKKKIRPQTVRVVHHKAPPAAPMESSVNVNFVRGCATAADIPLLASRFNINAEKIHINFPVSVVPDESHCIHYAAAASPSSASIIVFAYPGQDTGFNTFILRNTDEAVNSPAFSSAAVLPGTSMWREINLSVMDSDSATESEISGIPEHLQWELTILSGEISKKIVNPENYYLRVVLENSNDADPEKVRGLELIEKNTEKLIDSVVWLEREDEAGSFFNTGGADFEKLFWQSPVKFRRLSRGIGKSITTEKKRVKLKIASKKKKQKFRKIIVKHHRQHIGVDFAAPMGTPVNAVAEANVAFMGSRGAYGNLIVLEHGGDYHTYYAHLSKFADDLYVGKKIIRGEEIGLVGSTGRSTGPHLHFEIRKQGLYVNPLSDDYSLDFWRLHGDESVRLLTDMLRLDIMRENRRHLMKSTLNTLQ